MRVEHLTTYSATSIRRLSTIRRVCSALSLDQKKKLASIIPFRPPNDRDVEPTTTELKCTSEARQNEAQPRAACDDVTTAQQRHRFRFSSKVPFRAKMFCFAHQFSHYAAFYSTTNFKCTVNAATLQQPRSLQSRMLRTTYTIPRWKRSQTAR